MCAASSPNTVPDRRLSRRPAKARKPNYLIERLIDLAAGRIGCDPRVPAPAQPDRRISPTGSALGMGDRLAGAFAANLGRRDGTGP